MVGLMGLLGIGIYSTLVKTIFQYEGDSLWAVLLAIALSWKLHNII